MKLKVHYDDVEDGIAACGVSPVSRLCASSTADRSKVTCGNCIKTRAYKTRLTTLEILTLAQTFGDENGYRTNVKVYICIIENKRSEATAEVFSTSEAAINYARELAKSRVHDSEEMEELEGEGWLYAANYSYDGLGVFVVEKELDAQR